MDKERILFSFILSVFSGGILSLFLFSSCRIDKFMKILLIQTDFDKQQLDPSDLEPRRSHRVPKKNRRFIEL
jgi:hypothetical protein